MKRGTQRSGAGRQQRLDVNAGAAGSRAQAARTHFSDEGKEAGCPSVPWDGWMDSKRLRTGKHGETEADSTFYSSRGGKAASATDTLVTWPTGLAHTVRASPTR